MKVRKLTPSQMPSRCGAAGCEAAATHFSTGYLPNTLTKVGGTCCWDHRQVVVTQQGGR